MGTTSSLRFWKPVSVLRQRGEKHSKGWQVQTLALSHSDSGVLYLEAIR